MTAATDDRFTHLDGEVPRLLVIGPVVNAEPVPGQPQSDRYFSRLRVDVPTEKLQWRRL